MIYLDTLDTLGKKYLTEGRTKTVYLGEDGYVYKYFREGYTINFKQFKEQITKKQENLGEYIPETSLELDPNGNIYIKQKYIPGKKIKDIDINTLSKEQLESLVTLIQSYISHCKIENETTDFIGHQGFDNIFLASIELIKVLPKSFLSSSNIILSEEGKFYMVDVVDIDWATTPFLSFLDKVSQKILKIFVNRTLKKIKKIQMKTNSELSDTI